MCLRYTYYSDTQKILGNTYGMCVLQDFEALTPNLLARTVETVEGGGLIVLLLRTMKSLKQLYTLSMVRTTASMLEERKKESKVIEKEANDKESCVGEEKRQATCCKSKKKLNKF